MSNGGFPLDHPLLGFRARYTTFAIAYLGIVVVGILLDGLLSRGAIDVLPGLVSLPIEFLIAVLVLFVALSAAVGPSVYALVNGGPALAAAISLVPQMTIAVVSWTWVLTNDFVVALIGAAIGAGLGVGHQFYRMRDRKHVPSRLVDGLLLATGLTILAIVGANRFVGVAPPPTILPIQRWLWAAMIPVVVCLGCWLLVVRSWSVEEIVEVE